MITIYKNMPMKMFFEKSENILYEHWDEIANNKTVIKLSPDKKAYYHLEKAGVLSNAVILEDDEIIGYVIVLTSPMLHYKENAQSFVDVIYLKPSERKGRLGLKLINLAEELAVSSGATSIVHHTKPHHRSLEKILISKGFKVAEYNLTKLLKG